MNGHQGYYAKWSKSDRVRQLPHALSYTWNLKKKKKLIDREQTWFARGGGWEVEEMSELYFCLTKLF